MSIRIMRATLQQDNKLQMAYLPAKVQSPKWIDVPGKNLTFVSKRSGSAPEEWVVPTDEGSPRAEMYFCTSMNPYVCLQRIYKQGQAGPG